MYIYIYIYIYICIYTHAFICSWYNKNARNMCTLVCTINLA